MRVTSTPVWLALVAAVVCGPCRPTLAAAGTPGGGQLLSSLRLLAWGAARDPADTPLGGVEELTGPAGELRAELRWDASWRRGPLQLRTETRASSALRRFEQRPEGEEADAGAELFLGEGEVRVEAARGLFLSYGRFAMDWGPSRIFPASNPFGGRHARRSPKEELPGSDFFLARWAPDSSWTLSLMANTAAGRRRAPGFRRRAVFTAERVVREGHFGLVLSRAEDGDDASRLGFHGVRTLSEALVVHAEAGAAERDVELVAGCSYTFTGGNTLTVEYFHNGGGAAAGDPALLALALADGEGREIYLRRNYLLVQVGRADYLTGLEAFARVVHNIDDGSSALVGHIERGAGDRVRVFLFALAGLGGRGGELAAVLRSSLMLGAEYTY